jgi:hypothetical protein
LGDPTGSNATAGLALRVTGTHKPLYHGKVKIPTKGRHIYPVFRLSKGADYLIRASRKIVSFRTQLASEIQQKHIYL